MTLPAPRGGLPSAELQQKSFHHCCRSITNIFHMFQSQAQYNTTQHGTTEGQRGELRVSNTDEQPVDL
jgi:hypothetical protein